MDSIDSACTPLKAKYDECFNRWFKDFLQGNDNHERSCGAVFKQYQKCVKKALEEKKLNLPDLVEDALRTVK